MVPIDTVDNRRMRARFSAHADDYDRYASVQKLVIDSLCRQIGPLGPLAGPLLDIGTGTGALAEALGGHLPTGDLVVMDIAHGMTRQAHRRLGGPGACDADACLLPFRGAAFASVVSSSVYQWVAELSTAFAEVARVLQPDGLFAAALFGEQTLVELRSSHRHAIAEGGSGQLSHVQDFPGLNEVRAALEGSGLQVLTSTRYLEVEYHPDVPVLLRQLKQIGASNASRRRPRGLASRKVMLEMVRWYEENYRNERGLPATYEIILFLASKKHSMAMG